MKNQNSKPKIISHSEAIERFNLEDEKYEPFSEIDYSFVLLFDGDIEVNKNLDQTWFNNLIKQENIDNEDETLIIVNGDLNVNGMISLILDIYPHLFVTGDVKCHSILTSEENIYICGSAYIKYVFYGFYPGGIALIEGTTHVPYVLNDEHCSDINITNDTITLNLSVHENNYFDYDFTRDKFKDVFLPVLIDEENGLDVAVFIKTIKSGIPPFKKGVV